MFLNMAVLFHANVIFKMHTIQIQGYIDRRRYILTMHDSSWKLLIHNYIATTEPEEWERDHHVLQLFAVLMDCPVFAYFS